MRLLIDENLSPRLVVALSEDFPDSAHVRPCSFADAMTFESGMPRATVAMSS